MKKPERNLLRLHNALNEQGQDMLRVYAEFLCTQPENVAHMNKTRQQPKAVSAAEDESVVAAIKRLSESTRIAVGLLIGLFESIITGPVTTF